MRNIGEIIGVVIFILIVLGLLIPLYVWLNTYNMTWYARMAMNTGLTIIPTLPLTGVIFEYILKEFDESFSAGKNIFDGEDEDE